MESSPYQTKQRLMAVICLSAFVFFILFARLFALQIIDGAWLRAKAADQWTRDLPIIPKRGDILDTNGNVLASSETAYTVYVRAKSVTDARFVAEKLSALLGLDYDAVYAKVSDRGVSEATLKRQVDGATADEIRSFNFNGVYLASEPTRVYTYGDFLSQVLGYVSSDNVGQTGIEAYYDKYLKGIKGQILTQSDLVGVEIKDKEMIYVPGIDGLDVVLTIDSVIQSVVEDVLRFIMRAHNPKSAKAVVMNVNTGEILAMGITPGLDLNNLPRDDIQTLMDNGRNTLLTDIYEPGSTFKIITAAANMEEYKNGNPSAFSPTHVFGNSNFRIINGSRISCWTSHANGRHSNQTLAAALNNSCNPIFTDIALSLGVKTFYDYLDLFGIGENTGIDFAGEQAGMLVPEASVTAGDLARIGFGQTIAVTPLQLITAVSCAVNGGLLMKPYLVREIRSGDMTAARFTPSVRNRAVSEETSRNLALMLEDVVKNGSGKQAYIEGYRVGGKTGTAQKFENGHIADGKYVSSFVGFFPANRPEYAAIVIVDEPEGQHYGSTVAAPYAKIIFQQIINYKNIKPVS